MNDDVLDQLVDAYDLVDAAMDGPDGLDAEACLRELDRVAPDLSDEAKRSVLDWVLHWDYLR